jgi:phosphatidylglycerophosphate synthase
MDDSQRHLSQIEEEHRRPIRARRWNFFEKISQSLANHHVSPNAISLATIPIALAGSALMLLASIDTGLTRRLLLVGAAATILLRLIGNLLDGMVAECAGSASISGRLYNDGPDRITDILFFSAFGFLGTSKYSIALGVLAACLAVLAAYTRELSRAIRSSPPFHGPMSKPQRMSALVLALLLLAFLPSRWISQGSDSELGFVDWALLVIIAGTIITCYRRWRYLLHNANNNE